MGNTVTCIACGLASFSQLESVERWQCGWLSNDSRVTIYEDLVTENAMTFVQSILELCSAEQADAGQYSCIAENTLGNDTASFMLTVNAQSK